MSRQAITHRDIDLESIEIYGTGTGVHYEDDKVYCSTYSKTPCDWGSCDQQETAVAIVFSKIQIELEFANFGRIRRILVDS